MGKETVWIVSDRDGATHNAMGETLAATGFSPQHERSTSFLERLPESDCRVVLLDVANSPFLDIELLRQIGAISPSTQIIVLTDHAFTPAQLDACREHVFAFLRHPCLDQELVWSVRKAVEWGRLNGVTTTDAPPQTDTILKHETSHREKPSLTADEIDQQLVGESPEMVTVRKLIREVAPTGMTTLIRGESGTGKDVVARLIHKLSGRDRTGAFVKVNCPAIPDTLLESELFGHDVGAFTGAVRQKPGRFEMSAGGTIFLDEICSMSPSMQAALLQVIEYKQFTRVGGRDTINVNTRIVAATNGNLENMIREGKFRLDLYYRLKQFTIPLPPLRKRGADIPMLTEHFIESCPSTRRDWTPRLEPDHLAHLINYGWPGNVRELKAVMERLAISSDFSVIDELQSGAARTSGPFSSTEDLRNAEVRAIMATLVESKWNRRRAAQMLGVSYSTLRRRIQKYGLNNCTS